MRGPRIRLPACISRGASCRSSWAAALYSESPTLARRFPSSGPGTRPYRLAPPLPVLSSLKSDHLLSAVDLTLAMSVRTALNSSPRSRGTVTLSRVGSACRAREYAPSVSSCESTLSATTSPPGSSFGRGEREEPLVVVLLGVEEDDVEDVLDRRQRLERVALDELGPLVEPGVGDVPPPGLALRRVVLEREHAAAEDPRAGGEPDRRVPARAADLEHLARVLRRDEREQEPPGRRRDRPRALLARRPRARARRRPPPRGARARRARGRRASRRAYVTAGRRRRGLPFSQRLPQLADREQRARGRPARSAGPSAS